MKWRLRGKIKRGEAQDRFLRSLRGFLLPQPPLLRCRGSVPWHGDSALALQSHPQLPRGFLWERSRLFLSLLGGEKRSRCIQRRWQRGSSPRAGVAGQGGGSVPAGGGGDTALSPPEQGHAWVTAAAPARTEKRKRFGAGSWSPGCVPKSPRGAHPVPAGPWGAQPWLLPTGKLMEKGLEEFSPSRLHRG